MSRVVKIPADWRSHSGSEHLRILRDLFFNNLLVPSDTMPSAAPPGTSRVRGAQADVGSQKFVVLPPDELLFLTRNVQTGRIAVHGLPVDAEDVAALKAASGDFGERVRKNWDETSRTNHTVHQCLCEIARREVAAYTSMLVTTPAKPPIHPATLAAYYLTSVIPLNYANSHFQDALETAHRAVTNSQNPRRAYFVGAVTPKSSLITAENASVFVAEYLRCGFGGGRRSVEQCIAQLSTEFSRAERERRSTKKKPLMSFDSSYMFLPLCVLGQYNAAADWMWLRFPRRVKPADVEEGRRKGREDLHVSAPFPDEILPHVERLAPWGDTVMSLLRTEGFVNGLSSALRPRLGGARVEEIKRNVQRAFSELWNAEEVIFELGDRKVAALRKREQLLEEVSLGRGGFNGEDWRTDAQKIDLNRIWMSKRGLIRVYPQETTGHTVVHLALTAEGGESLKYAAEQILRFTDVWYRCELFSNGPELEAHGEMFEVLGDRLQGLFADAQTWLHAHVERNAYGIAHPLKHRAADAAQAMEQVAEKLPALSVDESVKLLCRRAVSHATGLRYFAHLVQLIQALAIRGRKALDEDEGMAFCEEGSVDVLPLLRELEGELEPRRSGARSTWRKVMIKESQEAEGAQIVAFIRQSKRSVRPQKLFYKALLYDILQNACEYGAVGELDGSNGISQQNNGHDRVEVGVSVVSGGSEVEVVLQNRCTDSGYARLAELPPERKNQWVVQSSEGTGGLPIIARLLELGELGRMRWFFDEANRTFRIALDLEGLLVSNGGER